MRARAHGALIAVVLLGASGCTYTFAAPLPGADYVAHVRAPATFVVARGDDTVRNCWRWGLVKYCATGVRGALETAVEGMLASYLSSPSAGARPDFVARVNIRAPPPIAVGRYVGQSALDWHLSVVDRCGATVIDVQRRATAIGSPQQTLAMLEQTIVHESRDLIAQSPIAAFNPSAPPPTCPVARVEAP